MEEMSREEFLQQKADAERRIKELYKGHNMPPYPDFVSLSEGRRQNSSQTIKATPPAEEKKETPQAQLTRPVTQTSGFAPARIFKFLNLPELLKSSDAMLILGLIFLLMSDNADEKLILALVFIML